MRRLKEKQEKRRLEREQEEREMVERRQQDEERRRKEEVELFRLAIFVRLLQEDRKQKIEDEKRKKEESTRKKNQISGGAFTSIAGSGTGGRYVHILVPLNLACLLFSLLSFLVTSLFQRSPILWETNLETLCRPSKKWA